MNNMKTETEYWQIESGGCAESVKRSDVPAELRKRCCFDSSTLHPGGVVSRREYARLAFYENTVTGEKKHVATVYADNANQLLQLCERI